MRASSLVGIALCVVALATTGPADATPRGETREDAVAHQASRARFAEGLRHYRKRRWDEARIAFREAVTLERRPVTLLMLAESSLAAGRPLDALEAFDAYVAEETDLSAKARAFAVEGRRRALAQLGHVYIVASAPAEVSVDGGERRRVEPGAALEVAPGSHTLVITTGGRETVRAVDIARDQTITIGVAVALSAAAESGAPRVSWTPRSTSPGAERPRASWPVYLFGAVGLAGLGAAAVFGGLAANSDHAADVASGALARAGQSPARCAAPHASTPYAEACSTLLRNEAAADDHGTAMAVSLGVGAAGIALATGFWLLVPGSREGHVDEATAREARARISPWMSTSGGGAAIEGRF